jgi:hypothetical protein
MAAERDSGDDIIVQLRVRRSNLGALTSEHGVPVEGVALRLQDDGVYELESTADLFSAAFTRSVLGVEQLAYELPEPGEPASPTADDCDVFCEECGAKVTYRLGAWHCPTHRDLVRVKFVPRARVTVSDPVVYTTWECPVCNADAIFAQGSEGATEPFCGNHDRLVQMRPHSFYPHLLVSKGTTDA